MPIGLWERTIEIVEMRVSGADLLGDVSLGGVAAFLDPGLISFIPLAWEEGAIRLRQGYDGQTGVTRSISRGVTETCGRNDFELIAKDLPSHHSQTPC